MKRVFISLVLAFIFAFSTVSFASTGGLKDKKKKLNEVNENISSLKGQIKDVNNKQDDVMAAINKINAEADKVQDEINSIGDKINSTNSSIEVQKRKLEEAIADYNDHKDLYFDRVKVMYMEGPSGYLDILLSSESFSDLISRADMIKSIIEYDRNILKEMKEKQDLITYSKEKLQSKKEELIGLQKEELSKKEQLAADNEKKKNYYAKLEQDENELKKALKNEEEESNSLESQIRNIQKQMSNKPSQGSDKGSSIHYSGSKSGIVRASDIGYMPSITSRFGRRFHPILHEWKTHTGIDISVPSGTPVYSMADGEVIIASTMSGYGKVVVIDHGDGISTLYAHNSKVIVSVGQHVKKGEQVSVSGMTGYATGPHLHFEVRSNGTPINPEPYFIVGQ